MKHILLLSTLVLAACGVDEELTPPPAEILRVEVTPNPVAPGDTALFKAVTSRQVVQHVWTFSAGRAAYPLSRDTISWIAPEELGTYQHAVTLNEIGFRLDRNDFSIEVNDD